MLTTRQNRNAMAAIAGTVSRGLVNQIASQAVRQGINYVDSYFTQGGRQALLPKPTITGGSIQKITTVKGKVKSNRRKNRNRQNVPSTPRVVDRIRVTLKDATVLANTAGSTFNDYLQIACTYTATKDMRTWLPRAGTTLTGAFRFFRVNLIRLNFQPYLAYTSTGYIAIGVDPTPESAAPGSLGNVIRHSPSCAGDVKDHHELVWRPGDDAESIDKLTNAASASTNPQSICQGSIQIFSDNSALISVVIGVLFYEVEIEFFGLA